MQQQRLQYVLWRPRGRSLICVVRKGFCFSVPVAYGEATRRHCLCRYVIPEPLRILCFYSVFRQGLFQCIQAWRTRSLYVENEVLVGSGCMWMQQGMAVGFTTTRLRVVFWLTRRVQKAFSAMLVALASIVVVAEGVWHFCCVLYVSSETRVWTGAL